MQNLSLRIILSSVRSGDQLLQFPIFLFQLSQALWFRDPKAAELLPLEIERAARDPQFL